MKLPLHPSHLWPEVTEVSSQARCSRWVSRSPRPLHGVLWSNHSVHKQLSLLSSRGKMEALVPMA
jgi:hypothetical protein